MIKSTISSSHFYYLLFFESTKLKTSLSIYDLFDFKKDIAELDTKKRNESIYHLQLLIDKQYGSDSILSDNKVIPRSGAIFYWYDFYIGRMLHEGKSIFYVCYPYNALSTYLQSLFEKANLKVQYHKPSLDKVLKYMRTRGEKGASTSKLEKEGFDFDITKYTAEVKEEINAKRVNIVGDNPLNSRIYEVLEKAKDITIKPISLKMKCKKFGFGELEVSFDKLGKYRFWLKRDHEDLSLPMLANVYKFFSETKSLEYSDYISSLTFLEDE